MERISCPGRVPGRRLCGRTGPGPAQSVCPSGPPYGAAAISRLRAEFERDPSLRERYSAVSMFLEVNEMLNEQKLPLVIINRRNLVTWVPLLYQPLRDRYMPLDIQVTRDHPLNGYYNSERKVLYSREEQLQFLVPRAPGRPTG